MIREGSRGFLGMGGEDAIVRVTTRESAETAGPGRPRTPRGGGDGDRNREGGGGGGDRGRQRGRRGGRQRGEREGGEGQRNDAPRSQDQPRDDNRGNRQEPRGDRGPRDNRGRGDQPRGEQRDQPRGDQRNEQRDQPRGDQRNEQRDQPRGDRDDRGNRSGPRSRGGRGGGRDGGGRDGGNRDGGNREQRRGREPRDPSTITAVDSADEIRVPGAPSDLPASIKSDPEDEVDLFGSTLRDLLVILGLSETSITARDPETPGDGVGLISQVFDVFGENDEISDELAVLIGRRGETLNALQYLLNVLVSKHTDGDLVFSVDIEGYRSRRERTLVDMAHEIAAEVRATGDVITLEPMPAAERRIIHLILESEEGITTESVGRGTDRQVEVMPD